MRNFVVEKTDKYGKDWVRFELWKTAQQPLILSDGARGRYDLLIVRCFFYSEEVEHEDEARLVFALGADQKVCGMVEKAEGLDW